MRATTTSKIHHSSPEVFPEPSRFDPTRGGDYDFFRGNTAIPDNTFGPDEERIFIDEDPFEAEEAVFAIEHKDVSRQPEPSFAVPTVTMMNLEGHSTRHHHGSAEYAGRNQRGTQSSSSSASHLELISQPTIEREAITQSGSIKSENAEEVARKSSNGSDKITTKITENFNKGGIEPSVSSVNSSLEEDESKTGVRQVSETSVTMMENASTTSAPIISEIDERGEVPEEQESETGSKAGKEMMRNVGVSESATAKVEASRNVTPVVLGSEDKNQEPTIGSVAVFSKGIISYRY